MEPPWAGDVAAEYAVLAREGGDPRPPILGVAAEPVLDDDRLGSDPRRAEPVVLVPAVEVPGGDVGHVSRPPHRFRRAAVDADAAAGHERGDVGAQHDDHLRDLLGCSDSPEW